MSNLVERLRRTKIEQASRVSSLGFVIPLEDTREVSINPDGPEAADRIEALEATQAELVDNLDTLEKLRADLAEESPGRHAQRIAVLDIHITRQRALLAKLEQQP